MRAVIMTLVSSCRWSVESTCQQSIALIAACGFRVVGTLPSLVDKHRLPEGVGPYRVLSDRGMGLSLIWV